MPVTAPADPPAAVPAAGVPAAAGPPTGTPPHAAAPALDAVLAAVAADAARLDAEPAFPTAAFAALAQAGALASDQPYAHQLRLVRAVARADGSVGRILDGHLNAAERLRLLARPDDEAVAADLAAIDAGELWLGLLGADPVAEEGEPAAVSGRPGAWRVSGAKVFCSGAGGVHRAAILARPPDRSSPPWLVYVDLGAGVAVDRGWYRGAGMRASESHRVSFDRARVIAVLGEPGELARDPWFSRDAIRTAASWAGMADTAVAGAVDALVARPRRGDLEGLAAGRILAAQRTIDLWLADAAAATATAPPAPAGPTPAAAPGGPPTAPALRALSVDLREAVSRAASVILDEAARACGSRPFARGSSLDRARRDLELLLLQHRLDPLVARRGGLALDSWR